MLRVGAGGLHAVALDLVPGEAAVLGDHVEAGALDEHAGVRPVARRERLGAGALPLLVDHAGDQQVAAKRVVGRQQRLDGEEHRREPALHVGRAAPVHAALAHDRLERVRAPRPHHVEVPEQHEAGAVAGAGQPADDVGPAGQHVPRVDLEAEVFQALGEVRSERRLARPARQPGFVLSMRTISARSVSSSDMCSSAGLLMTGPERRFFL